MNWVAPIKDENTLNQFRANLKALDLKYYIMFEIGIGTGMQLQEILKLKNKDVRGKDKLVVTIGTKGTEREYTFSPELKKIIEDYTKDKDPDGFLITGHASSSAALSREQAYRVFKSVGRSMGISSIGAQTMRKTFAWRYYKETGDIYYLQELFNHASPSITYRYIGEKPNVAVILKKMTPEENERSRYMLYYNDSGKKRLGAIVTELSDILERFDSPANNDAFYGKVDCLLEELELLMDNYRNTK
jgi:integrase